MQFLVVGGALFAAWALFGPAADTPGDLPLAAAPGEVIVIDAAVIASLEEGYAAVWRRPPTPAERQGLIDEHLAQEVLYREAQKLGLDRDDVVIRRRLQQKMEFLLQDSLSLAPPTQQELQAFFDANQARYRAADRISFQQIYLGDTQRPADTPRWQALAARLNEADPPDPQTLGQGSLLPPAMRLATPAEIARSFGNGFAEQLIEAPSGRWWGPVQSGFGWHLVRVDRLQRPADPEFAAVRGAVERDYAYQREGEAASALIARLKAQYQIVIDGADATDATGDADGAPP